MEGTCYEQIPVSDRGDALAAFEGGSFICSSERVFCCV